MTAVPDELRLAYVVALTALVFACAVWFSRRMVGGDWVETLIDGLLITFVIQYAAVGVPGVFGALNAWSIAVTAVLGCAVLGALAREKPPPPRVGPDPGAPRRIKWAEIAIAVFVGAYLLTLLSRQWVFPPFANDPLTYHLPASVQWLQAGHITLHETWFYNPANTYSPLAGSVLATWWLAPMHSDVLARFVQAPALILLFVAMIQIIRALGVSTTVAAMIAAGAALSRPFISQTILAKDDLFLAAFFATTVAGLTRVKLTDALGPWRVGLALGLLLATKYTALLSLPLLVLAIDAPMRVGWKLREAFIAGLCALALAGPWYLRNAIVTGNPLFPMDLPGFEGLFATRRSPELASLNGLWTTLVTGYFSTTIPLAIVLVSCWVGAVVTFARHVWRTPLVRLCLLGPPIGVALFVMLSPYAEVRFIYPSLLLMFACAGALAFAVRNAPARLAVGAVVLLAGLGTGFVPRGLLELLPLAIGLTVLVILIAIGLMRLPDEARLRAVAIVAVVLVAMIGSAVYIYFDAFLRAPGAYADSRAQIWKDVPGGYGALADAWGFIDRHVPLNATIAYTNTFFTYPLYGFDLRRSVVYAPVRAEVRHLHDLGKSTERLSGEQIVPFVSKQLTMNARPDVWLDNLARRGADHLLIVKPGTGPSNSVPEIDFARADPSRFVAIFENEAAIVYRIDRSPAPATNHSPSKVSE